MSYLEIIEAAVGEKQDLLTDISDKIWDYSEIRYEEVRSSELLAATLEREGFSVQRRAGGIETAFVASYGEGGPVVAILGEYDALSNLSQAASSLEAQPIESGGNGHGCGHNLLGTGALTAVLALKACKDSLNLPGTIKYFGCPAEEGGGGKAFMAREGLFDGVDVAFTWHPWDENLAYHARMLATNQIYFTFHGRASHAAFTPHLGRSALDAVELMNVGVNFLREHVVPEARLHYAITNAGGKAPNVVQAEAQVLYKIRAPRTEQVREITERVMDVAKGAAQMTGTSVEIAFDAASAELVPNEALALAMHEEFLKIGAPRFTNEEKEFAHRIQQTFSEGERERIAFNNKVLSEEVNAFTGEIDFINGSTDVGDVSWIVPTGQIYVATCAYGTPGHSWQMVSQGKSSTAHKGMLHAGKVMAASAVRVLENPDLIAAAKAEHRKQLGGAVYKSLIPATAKPSRVA